MGTREVWADALAVVLQIYAVALALFGPPMLLYFLWRYLA